MNKLIVPAVIAVLAGVGGGSGVAYVSAKKAAGIVAVRLAATAKAHAKDSTDKAEKLQLAADSAASDSLAKGPLTPADSIRAMKELPTTLTEATHGLANAVDPKHGRVTAPIVDAGHSGPVAANEKVDPKKVLAVKPKPVAVAPVSAEPVQPVPVAAAETPLPEKRIAKIFGAMQSKDAARVLEQMNDSDVRIILSMMPDKQAAAILTTFPPQRAAAISRGEVRNNKKPSGVIP